MPDSETTIRIDHLHLRMRADTAQTGHRIANGIVETLGRKIPQNLRRHLGMVSLRVTVPASATESETTEVVAEAILKALKKGVPPGSG